MTGVHALPGDASMKAVSSPPEVRAKSEVRSLYGEALTRVNFPMDQVRALMKPRPGRILVALGGTAATFVAVPLLYKLVPSWVTFILCFVLSIRTFNCFAQLVHTSDHGALFLNPTLNRVV